MQQLRELPMCFENMPASLRRGLEIGPDVQGCHETVDLVPGVRRGWYHGRILIVIVVVFVQVATMQRENAGTR